MGTPAPALQPAKKHCRHPAAPLYFSFPTQRAVSSVVEHLPDTRIRAFFPKFL
jgi:hypothetical protein